MMKTAALCLLTGSLLALADPVADSLPKEARAPVPDVNSQPPLKPDPPGRVEHTGKVVQVDFDRIILVDRLGLRREVVVNTSTKVWRRNTAILLEDVKTGETVKTSAPKGKPAETVAVVDDE